jgi:CheY-like chemotaxis protein
VFRVRASRAAAAAREPFPARPAAPALPAARRVLVVDDDAAVRRATVELLVGWGCEVREAGGAAEALRTAAGWMPELVLADYQLGSGALGTELVTRLREGAGAGLAAVILTGDSEGPSLEAIRAAGFVVLRKPVRPARLRALLAARG